MTSHYLPQVYMPCITLVILSWISFWLNRRASHVRLVLCALAMLLMTICLTILYTQMPKTSYTKAIDVYTGICMTFVFVALVGKSRIFIALHVMFKGTLRFAIIGGEMWEHLLVWHKFYQSLLHISCGTIYRRATSKRVFFEG